MVYTIRLPLLPEALKKQPDSIGISVEHGHNFLHGTIKHNSGESLVFDGQHASVAHEPPKYTIDYWTC